MPWRELVFTNAGVAYPVTWDMHKHIRDKVESTVHKELLDSATLPDAASTSENISPAAMTIATQDLFSRISSAPASSLPRTDERAALPAETSPCCILRTERRWRMSKVDTVGFHWTVRSSLLKAPEVLDAKVDTVG